MSAVLELTEKKEKKASEQYVKETHQISAKDYDLMIEHGILTENDKVELLDGEIINKMPKGKKRAYFNDLISDFLREKFGKEAVIRNQNSILLDEFSEPEPDIALCKSPRKKYLENHPAPEDILLIVEISDTTLQFDRIAKGEAYSRAGIGQYLIVNVENETIEDYREPAADGFQSKRTYKQGEKFALQAFPEIEIKVEDFLKG